MTIRLALTRFACSFVPRELGCLAELDSVDSTFAMNNMKRWAYSPA